MNPISLWRRNGPQPFPTLARIQNDFERLFQEIAETETRLRPSEFCPSCEFAEDKTNYVVKFDLPGIKKDDVKIEIDERQLTVSAERREETKSEDKRKRLAELFYGSYQRSFALPSSVNEKNVDAKFEDGVLTITLPKIEPVKTKQIPVQ